jgi:dipeptidase
MYGCVSLSIGNRSIANEENKNVNDSNTVYSQNGKTMVAINYILPQRAGQFEMLTKTIIMPAMKREDGEVFKSLKFLVPEEQNEDGNLTYMFIADPYLEEKNYDIFEVLVSQYGRTRAEEYFDRWISCFAYEQEVISFR